MFLGVEMAAFELGVCSGGERFVSDQDTGSPHIRLEYE